MVWLVSNNDDMGIRYIYRHVNIRHESSIYAYDMGSDATHVPRAESVERFRMYSMHHGINNPSMYLGHWFSDVVHSCPVDYCVDGSAKGINASKMETTEQERAEKTDEMGNTQIQSTKKPLVYHIRKHIGAIRNTSVNDVLFW